MARRFGSGVTRVPRQTSTRFATHYLLEVSGQASGSGVEHSPGQDQPDPPGQSVSGSWGWSGCSLAQGWLDLSVGQLFGNHPRLRETGAVEQSFGFRSSQAQFVDGYFFDMASIGDVVHRPETFLDTLCFPVNHVTCENGYRSSETGGGSARCHLRPPAEISLLRMSFGVLQRLSQQRHV